ncbi:HU family DNA-binding protein (plasmid) [Bacillus cereus]
MQHTLQNREHVQLLSFDTFEAPQRTARKGRNSKNGEAPYHSCGKNTCILKLGKY